MKSKRVIFVLPAVACLFLVACGSGNKEAATTAVNAAEESYNAVKSDVAQYVPDQAKGVEDAIKGAKDNLDKGNYDEALNAAKTIPDSVKQLSAAVATKKAELTKTWQDMSGGLPKMLDAVKSRLGILSASKNLPANLDKTKLDGAKADYETAAKMWTDAQGAFSSGNVADAVTKANTVRAKAMEVMSTLGMKVPAAASTKG